MDFSQSDSVTSRWRSRSIWSIGYAVLTCCLLVGLSWMGSSAWAENAEKTLILPERSELLRPFGSADRDAFRTPSKVYHPETWFHYIGGNVSLEGITADLEAISAAGLAGVQLFHGQFGGPWPRTEEQIPCLSPKWDAAVRHTAEECQRLGLRFTMQNCPGWAMSGGPWIQPENAMRHLVWSRTDLQSDGTTPLEAVLVKPQPSDEPWRDYREVTVIAFPTPLDNEELPLQPTTIESSDPQLPWADCFAGDAHGQLRLTPTDETNPHWIEVTFPTEETLRTMEFPPINSFLHAYCYDPGVTITVEKVVANAAREPITQVVLPPASWQDDRPISLACDETRGTTFRISVVNRHEMQLNSIRLFRAAKVNNWESEAGWTLRGTLRTGENPQQSPKTFVDLDAITLVADRMDSDGRFHVTLPAGRWTILRVGHVNTGQQNGPAPAEGTGWECNKLSRTGANTHFDGYIGRLVGQDGPIRGQLDGLLLDSWECKTQTWTDGLDKQFEERLGYSPLRYLPAVFGYVVRDHETSHQFLRDWRGTIGHLFVDEFYGQMALRARQNDLTIQYETAAGDIFPADILEYYKHADVPMCEFWQPISDGFVGSLNFKPIKPTASAAHIYGKPRVSAESFTSFELTWDERWEMLKEVFNRNAVEGVTHVVFHTCTHQPQTDFLPPGTSMGSNIGTPFVRGQTWWNDLPEFTDYLARCGFLLERGRPVSDVLWYLGDEIGHKPDQGYPFPEGFKYDYCNSDVLLHRLTVDNGELVTPEGLRYRVLWTPDARRMLPETLAKLRELVREGATIIGERPVQLATLAGGEAARRQFESCCQELWDEPTTDDGHATIRNVGRGRVVTGFSLVDAFRELGLQPDVLIVDAAELVGTEPVGTESVDTEPVLIERPATAEDRDRRFPGWLHRQIDGADWYFITAPVGKAFHGTFSFRNGGPIAERWDPVTGNITPLTVQTVPADTDSRSTATRSVVTLELPKAGASFVVFPSQSTIQSQSTVDIRHVADDFQIVNTVPLTAPWTLMFPAGWGVDTPIQVERLAAWRELPISEEGKAFSGTVHYETTWNLSPETWNTGDRITLDLGEVAMLATVRVNGQSLGTLWAHPYRLDVTQAVQSGENRLEIDVTSTWFNRLVYDAKLPEAERKTWTISGPSKDSALRESGLLGPVTLTIERAER